jgi:uncharacterized protein YjiS (DUF1127 family)
VLHISSIEINPPIAFKESKGNAMAHVTATRPLPLAGRSTPATLFGRVGSAIAVWRQRRALASLPAHLRRDVGLSAEDVDREARRHLWDVPNHWRF